MRYECFNCDKEFDEEEMGMCPHCHSTDFADREESYINVHLCHCYQGEYKTTCKYGENECPAEPKEIIRFCPFCDKKTAIIDEKNAALLECVSCNKKYKLTQKKENSDE